MNPLKLIFIILGTLSLAIGIIGLFIPGLPTTPFLLLTAGLYIRSSDKLYTRLISNPLIGPYILEFRRRKGMTSGAKLFAISIMWVMISISCSFFIHQTMIQIIILVAGIIGTIVMGIIVRTVDDTSNSEK